MSDLIRREDVEEALQGLHVGDVRFFEKLRKALDEIPSAEPERKKGEWKKIGHWGRHYRCDQCGNTLDFDGVNAGRGDANFCPNCGAEMTRGE